MIRSAGPAPEQATDLTVVCVVKNAAAHVEPFIRHHRALGASRFVLMDNVSTDETVSQALRFQEVTVLRCPLPLQKYSLAVRRYLTERFGEGGWVLLADIDERFTFPFAGPVTLRFFLDYLNQNAHTAVAAAMLDLFQEGPLETWPPAGMQLEKSARWFDPASIEKHPLPSAARQNRFDSPVPIAWRGGIRARRLGGNPDLTKFPLISRVNGARPRVVSAHYVRGGRVADAQCLLLHYRFDADFRELCVRHIRENSHFNRSAEYRRYLESLESAPTMVLRDERSIAYRSASQMLDLGLISASERFLSFADRAKTL